MSWESVNDRINHCGNEDVPVRFGAERYVTGDVFVGVAVSYRMVRNR